MEEYCTANLSASVCGSTGVFTVHIGAASQNYPNYNPGVYTANNVSGPIEKVAIENNSLDIVLYHNGGQRLVVISTPAFNPFTQVGIDKIDTVTPANNTQTPWSQWPSDTRSAAAKSLTDDDVKQILQTGSAGQLTAGQSLPNGAYVSPAAGQPLTSVQGPLTISEDGNEERNTADDQRLSKGEIEALKKGEEDPEALKDNNAGLDLFKDKKGNIYVKPKNGQGPGEPTGLNINDFL